MVAPAPGKIPTKHPEETAACRIRQHAFHLIFIEGFP